MQSLKKFYFGKAKEGTIPFVIRVNVTTSFTIPTFGTGYNYRIVTSDGQNFIGRTGATTITFPSAGQYDISIYGKFPRIYFNNTGDRTLIIDIKQWGNIKWSSFEKAYYGCSNLKMSAIDSPILGVNNSFFLAFHSCVVLGATGDFTNMPNWDVSNVIYMSSALEGMTLFNQNIGSWNVSNVVSFNSFLFNSPNFNQNLSAWNVSNATTTLAMFQNATAFNNGLASGVAGNMLWNLPRLTTASYMFQNATSFNQNLGALNLPLCTMFGYMFKLATSFNNGGSPDINNWVLNASAYINMSGMFSNTTAFNQPLNNWNVSNVTNFTNFMLGKTPATFSTANLDAIYNGWSSRPVKTPITISFGTAKYTAAGAAGRAILTSAPNNWVITDGGI